MAKRYKKEKIHIAIPIIAIITVILAIICVFFLNKQLNKRKTNETISKMEENEKNTEQIEEIVSIEQIEEIKEIEKIKEAPNQDKQINSTENYYIRINCQANVVTIYQRDKNGKYTIPIKAMTCSTGTNTPQNKTYKIQSRWRWLGLIKGVYGQYCTQIVGNILFHSVPYTQRYNNGSLEYWEYDKLGTTASAGCVRLTIADAKWIYENITSGTYVEFYNDSDPGPLGKKNTQKISNNEELRNWDPTDPDEANPWRNVQEEVIEEEKPDVIIVVTPEQNTKITPEENIKVTEERKISEKV